MAVPRKHGFYIDDPVATRVSSETQENKDNTQTKARLFVASCANGVDDCRLLLQMLGLI